MQRQVARAHALADVGGVMLDVRHGLAATRNDHVAHPGLHHHRGVDDRLQARSAAAVQLIAGDFLRQAGQQPRPVADARRLTVAVALAEHDIIDPRRIDLGAFHQRLQDHRAQLASGERGQRAAELADRGADRGDDGSAAQLGHQLVPTIPESIRRAISPEDSPSVSASTASLCWPMRGAGAAGLRSMPGKVAKAPAAG